MENKGANCALAPRCGASSPPSPRRGKPSRPPLTHPRQLRADSSTIRSFPSTFPTLSGAFRTLSALFEHPRIAIVAKRSVTPRVIAHRSHRPSLLKIRHQCHRAEGQANAFVIRLSLPAAVKFISVRSALALPFELGQSVAGKASGKGPQGREKEH